MRPGSEALLSRCREVWAALAGVPVTFSPVLRVVVSPESRLGPEGWAGIVVLGDAAVATAPDAAARRALQRAVRDVPAGMLTGPGLLRERCEITGVLGPAALAYLGPGEFRPGRSAGVIRPPDEEMRRFLAAASPSDAAESGLAEITSPPFAVWEHGQIAAAAGYRHWPGAVAHLSVLTARRARGRGYGRLVAAAAVEHAIGAGLLPQWRARPQASRRLARTLGFQELGSQISLRLTAARPDQP